MTYGIDFLLLLIILVGFQVILFKIGAGFPFNRLKTGVQIV